jgi:hypothetical protein
MVEFLAHELNRATQHALGTLAENKATNRPITPQTLQNLELQLKTLQKRLSTLDPATTSGRNRRERFDIAQIAQQTIDGHKAEFKRHNITAPDVVILPRQKSVEVLMVKGMVVQVLENLLSNSVYWLKQEQRLRHNFSARIDVVIDADSRELRVTDNGPGVSNADAEHIFKPFFTRKPPGEGKGLEHQHLVNAREQFRAKRLLGAAQDVTFERRRAGILQSQNFRRTDVRRQRNIEWREVERLAAGERHTRRIQQLQTDVQHTRMRLLPR